jgi:arginine repressor
MIRSEPATEYQSATTRRAMLAKIIREHAVGRQTELVALLRKSG